MSRDVFISTEYRHLPTYSSIAFFIIISSFVAFYLITKTASPKEKEGSDEPKIEMVKTQAEETHVEQPQTIQINTTPTPYPTLTVQQNQQLIQGLEELNPPAEVLNEIHQYLQQ